MVAAERLGDHWEEKGGDQRARRVGNKECEIRSQMGEGLERNVVQGVIGCHLTRSWAEMDQPGSCLCRCKRGRGLLPPVPCNVLSPAAAPV